MKLDLARRLHQNNGSKIVLCVLDGLGGLPKEETKRSELEQADTPNLDRLASVSELGMTVPVGIGITPGSGPGHLSLFGYDPYEYDVGRGVLEAVGIDFALGPDDVAARGNFCTLDEDGLITDRRAGRVSTDVSSKLVERLRGITIEGVEVLVEPVRDHRFVLVLRGAGLGDLVSTTDPQREGVTPLNAEGQDAPSMVTAEKVNDFVSQAGRLLQDEEPANGLTLRGFAKYPDLPQYADVWGLRAAALAVYPMYRGLARLVGMTALNCTEGMEQQITIAKQHWDEFDFFFIHYKNTDAAGEDGDYEAKVAALGEFDAFVPALRDLGADALMIGGDHSTPALMAAHSWHPVPFLINSTAVRGIGGEFNESDCSRGHLGTFPAVEAMPLAMAHAGRLRKYGA